MTDKTIIYEALKQTDWIPDWCDKVNDTTDKLRDAILSLYNNLRIDTTAKVIGGNTYDEVINGVNTEMVNVYSKNADGGIFFHSINNGNVSNRVAYIKETDTGNFEARFNNLILDDSLSVEGDFTLGSVGSENALNVVGPVEITGNFATAPGFVNVDNLEDGVMKISGLSNSIYFLNLSKPLGKDLSVKIDLLDDIETPAAKYPIKQGTTFRFIAGEIASNLNGKSLSLVFDNAQIVNNIGTPVTDEIDLGSEDFGKEIEVLVVGDAVGTATGYKIYVTVK